MSGGTTISTSDTKIEALQLQSSAFGVPIPVAYGVSRASGNLIWYNGFKATAHTTTQSSGGKGGGGVTSNSTTYTYSSSVMMGIAEGAVTAVPRIWKGKTVFVDGTTTALSQLGLTLASGAIGQATWSYLTTNYSAQAIGYSGMAYVYVQDYQLDTNASLDNHSFEIVATGAYAVSGSVPDANPATIAADLLTNTRYGASYPAAKLASTAAWSNYCLAANILLSPCLDTQMQAGEVIATLARVTNTAPIWTTAGLKMVPYGDAAMTGNGATYTPNNTPIYDLTDDDFTPTSAGGDPIKVTRKPQADAYNSVKVEFLNRANYYNIEVASASDSANIDAYGLRVAPTVTAHWICDAAIAQNVAQLVLQRLLYIRNTYQFSLPWTKALLEPMDLVTLTDTGLGFNKLAVRITEVSESDAGDLDVTAEEFPQGVASAAIYAGQASAGFQHNYAASPGSVSAPLVFEAPVSLTVTGLEVYAAVRGAGANWGGCRLWVSLDGTNYKDKGMVYGGARYGTITGPVSAGSLPVQLNAGQLISGSAADAANLSTLCYVGGAAPEYLAYTTATLTGASAYTLGGLNRSAYNSNRAAAAHTAGEAFVRVDAAIAKSGPLDTTMVGKTIYLKFTSFNIYNAAEEALASVTAYPYTIQGTMALIPPSQPTGMTATMEPFGLRIVCAANPEPDIKRYEYRSGATWASGTVIATDGGTSFLWAVQTAGTYTLWVAAVDTFNNYSAPTSASATVTPAAVSTPTATLAGTDLFLAWAGSAGSFSLAGYEVRYGATWAGGTLLGFRQVTNYQETILWGGTRTYWVAAVDVKGNYGTPVSQTVTVNAPGTVSGLYTSVVDNNALIYWTGPAIGGGQLPIDHYEVRKGTTWAAGTLIGSNGNSTFASWFEQQSGTYTFWVAAVDTAGNYGTAISTAAYINQPPDYILRASINSTFTTGGVSTVSMTNVLLQNGVLTLPVNTTETWTQHFTNNGYATPAAQIAAGNPLYIEPSLTTASYVELIDYGATLPATNITVTLNSTPIAGTVAASCQIDYSNTSATGPWTSAPAGATAALASNFRWVRVTYTFTATGAQNLLQVNGLNIKLSVKQRGDSGAGSVAVAASGAAVTFGYPFISADTPIVQPNGATPLIPVVVYTGGVNPTGFTVFLYTTAGVQTTGAFSWSVRGY